MTALRPRARRWVPIARDEYAFSPSTASGRVWDRPCRPGHAQPTQQRQQHGPVSCLAGGDQAEQGQPCTVDELVDLRAQPAPGGARCRERRALRADSVQFDPAPVNRVVFLACCCARAIVESTETDQSIRPSASAAGGQCAITVFQVPSSVPRRCLVHTSLPGPVDLGQVPSGDRSTCTGGRWLRTSCGHRRTAGPAGLCARGASGRSTPTGRRRASGTGTCLRGCQPTLASFSDMP